MSFPTELPKDRHYILENGLPKAVDLKTWSDWIESGPDRLVKKTVFEKLETRVVTVFLPCVYIDPTPEGTWKKYFYGTMVFGGPMDQHEEKTTFREEAEENHERLCARVLAISRGEIDPPSCCKK